MLSSWLSSAASTGSASEPSEAGRSLWSGVVLSYCPFAPSRPWYATLSQYGTGSRPGGLGTAVFVVTPLPNVPSWMKAVPVSVAEPAAATPTVPRPGIVAVEHGTEVGDDVATMSWCAVDSSVEAHAASRASETGRRIAGADCSVRAVRDLARLA